VLEDEALDLMSRLSFLIPERDGEESERMFTRVVELAELPEIMPGDGQVLDAGRMLAIRETAECRAFREWLRGVGALSDGDVRDLVRGLHSRISGAFQSRAGRILRFIAGWAVGNQDSTAGLIVGAIDQFILDHILREPGPVAFLNRLYPSIFRTTM
jgi:hypothetical protein